MMLDTSYQICFEALSPLNQNRLLSIYRLGKHMETSLLWAVLILGEALVGNLTLNVFVDTKGNHPKKSCLLMDIFLKRGRGFPSNQKVLR